MDRLESCIKLQSEAGANSIGPAKVVNHQTNGLVMVPRPERVMDLLNC
jgi:hypothetical protein